MKHRLITAGLFLFLVANAASAKTLHVALWGANDPGCGAATLPCLSINGALNQGGAGKNDRILVHPGKYVENVQLQSEVAGLKLESIAGRYATIIEASNPNVAVINALAERLRIGKRGKGFTIQGASTTTQAAIVAWSTGTRIEGNRFRGNTRDIRSTIIDKLQIRYNLFESNSDGFSIDCSGCERLLIRQNEFLNSDVGSIRLLGAKGINSVIGNEIEGDATQLHIINAGDNPRITDNALRGGATAIQAAPSSGALIKGNIVLNTFDTSIHTTPQESDSKGQSVLNNLVVGAGDGESIDFAMNIDGPTNQRVKVSGNTVVQSSRSAIRMDVSLTEPQIRSNATYGSENGYGLINANTLPLTFSQHFWGQPGGPDPDGIDLDGYDAEDGQASGSSANKPTSFKARRASGL